MYFILLNPNLKSVLTRTIPEKTVIRPRRMDNMEAALGLVIGLSSLRWHI